MTWFRTPSALRSIPNTGGRFGRQNSRSFPVGASRRLDNARLMPMTSSVTGAFGRKRMLLRLNLTRYHGNGCQRASLIPSCVRTQIKVKPSLSSFVQLLLNTFQFRSFYCYFWEDLIKLLSRSRRVSYFRWRWTQTSHLLALFLSRLLIQF